VTGRMQGTLGRVGRRGGGGVWTKRNGGFGPKKAGVGVASGRSKGEKGAGTEVVIRSGGWEQS